MIKIQALFTILQYSKKSKFRTFVTFFSVILATLILLSTISVSQAYVLRLQKANLVSILFSKNSPRNIFLSNTKETPSLISSSFSSEFNSYEIHEFGLRITNAEKLPHELRKNPAENELWVTSALKKLMDKNPDLRRRYENFQIRENFPQKLAPSPDSLALIFRIPDKALKNSNIQLQTFSSEQIVKIYEKQKIQNSEQFALVRAAVIFIAVLLITPIIIIIAETAKIGIIQRERRFATLSLAGATLGQVRLLIIFESLPVTILSLATAFAVFACPIMVFLSNSPLIGEVFWKNNLELPVVIYALVALIIIAVTIFANFQVLHKVKVSPLLVSRASGVQKHPSLFTILPLFLGIISLTLLVEIGRDWYLHNIDVGSLILAGLFLVIILGIFLSGPLLVYIIAKIFSKISCSAPGEIASYRLQNNARNIFRNISGVVVALFAGSIFATFLATSQAESSIHYVQSNEIFSLFEKPLQITVTTPDSDNFNESLLTRLVNSTNLQDIPSKSFAQKSFRTDNSDDILNGQYYESCEELIAKTRLNCPNKIIWPIVATLQVSPNSSKALQPNLNSVNNITGKVYYSNFTFITKTKADFIRAKNEIETITSDFQRETGDIINIRPNFSATNSLSKQAENLNSIINVILVTTILIGGLGIFVGVVGGIFERRRFFIQLKILGAKALTATLSLLAEIAIPLITISVLIITLGVFSCQIILKIVAEDSVKLVLPTHDFWALTIFAIVFLIISTIFILPIVKNIEKDNIHTE